MSRADTPTDPIDVLDGKILTAQRDATPGAIDPERYEPIPSTDARFYLATIAVFRDPTTNDTHATGIYATFDGSHVTSMTASDATALPHAIAAPRDGATAVVDVLDKRAVLALSRTVSQAHPEVPDQ